jgi:hypothetical protein
MNPCKVGLRPSNQLHYRMLSSGRVTWRTCSAQEQNPLLNLSYLKRTKTKIPFRRNGLGKIDWMRRLKRIEEEESLLQLQGALGVESQVHGKG